MSEIENRREHLLAARAELNERVQKEIDKWVMIDEDNALTPEGELIFVSLIDAYNVWTYCRDKSFSNVHQVHFFIAQLRKGRAMQNA